MAGADLVIVWRVTADCPLGCRFCGYSREVVRPRLSLDPDQVLTFGRVLAGYQQATGRKVLCVWLGGEALTWPPLEDLARTFHDELGLRQGITTSGVTLGSASVREHLAAAYDEVTVSVDGLAEFHDRVRQCPGLFARIRDGIRALGDLAERRRRAVLLRVNTVLMRGNIQDLEALCGEVAGWGVRELSFNALGGHERPEFYPENRLLPAQVDDLVRSLPALRQRMAARGMVIRGGPEYLHRLTASARGERIAVDDCEPGRRFLFVDEHGRVGPCSVTTSDLGVPLEEIRADLVGLQERFAASRQRARPAACDDCPATHVFDKFEP